MQVFCLAFLQSEDDFYGFIDQNTKYRANYSYNPKTDTHPVWVNDYTEETWPYEPGDREMFFLADEDDQISYLKNFTELEPEKSEEMEWLTDHEYKTENGYIFMTFNRLQYAGVYQEVDEDIE